MGESRGVFNITAVTVAQGRADKEELRLNRSTLWEKKGGKGRKTKGAREKRGRRKEERRPGGRRKREKGGQGERKGGKEERREENRGEERGKDKKEKERRGSGGQRMRVLAM